jgi:beta-N-acetylhexosaminidase
MSRTRFLLAAAVVGALLVAAVSRPSPDPLPENGLPSLPARTAKEPAESCAAVMTGLSLRRQLAQLVVVGVDAGDVTSTVRLVRTEQVGGIFVGGNATAVLRDSALSQVQAVAGVPVSVAVDDEGGRVQRIDALDGPFRALARSRRRCTRTRCTSSASGADAPCERGA